MESEMTTPAERTRAVRGTRQFLEILASQSGQLDHRLVRTLAFQLLQHFPLDTDIAISNRSVPTVWGTLQGDSSQASMPEVEKSDTGKSGHGGRPS